MQLFKICAFPRVTNQNILETENQSTTLYRRVRGNIYTAFFLHTLYRYNQCTLLFCVFIAFSFHKFRTVWFMIVSNVFQKNSHVYLLCVWNFIFCFFVIFMVTCSCTLGLSTPLQLATERVSNDSTFQLT